MTSLKFANIDSSKLEKTTKVSSITSTRKAQSAEYTKLTSARATKCEVGDNQKDIIVLRKQAKTNKAGKVKDNFRLVLMNAHKLGFVELVGEATTNFVNSKTGEVINNTINKYKVTHDAILMQDVKGNAYVVFQPCKESVLGMKAGNLVGKKAGTKTTAWYDVTSLAKNFSLLADTDTFTKKVKEYVFQFDEKADKVFTPVALVHGKMIEQPQTIGYLLKPIVTATEKVVKSGMVEVPTIDTDEETF